MQSAKSSLFDTSSWGPFCDVTLTLKQAFQTENGVWVKIDECRCKRAFRHFMNLLNRAVYGNTVKLHRKRVRVLPVLERGNVGGYSGRWHIHCAIELPSHLDTVGLERLIHECWAKVDWSYSRILVRDGTNASWVSYMLKDVLCC